MKKNTKKLLVYMRLQHGQMPDYGGAIFALQFLLRPFDNVAELSEPINKEEAEVLGLVVQDAMSPESLAEGLENVAHTIRELFIEGIKEPRHATIIDTRLDAEIPGTLQ